MPVNKKKRGSRIYDLGYRFMLWSSLSFILRYLAASADNKGGQRLVAALRNPPNDDYAMVIFGLALFLFVIALFMKDLHHLIRGITLLGRFSAMVVALVGRISSDLLISLYGMGAFIIGWMAYDGYQHYRESMIPDSRVQVLGLGLYEFLGLVLIIGIASLIVRVDEEHPVVKAWYEARFIWRMLAYLTFTLGLYSTFWTNPTELFTQMLGPAQPQLEQGAPVEQSESHPPAPPEPEFPLEYPTQPIDPENPDGQSLPGAITQGRPGVERQDQQGQ